MGDNREKRYKQDLVNRMGGMAQYDMTIFEFCDRLRRDVSLQPFYGSFDMSSLAKLQRETLDLAFVQFSSPKLYELVKARIILHHYRLLQNGLGVDHYELIREHFVTALRHSWVEEDVIEDAAKLLDSCLKKGIFAKEGESSDTQQILEKLGKSPTRGPVAEVKMRLHNSFSSFSTDSDILSFAEETASSRLDDVISTLTEQTDFGSTLMQDESTVETSISLKKVDEPDIASHTQSPSKKGRSFRGPLVARRFQSSRTLSSSLISPAAISGNLTAAKYFTKDFDSDIEEVEEDDSCHDESCSSSTSSDKEETMELEQVSAPSTPKTKKVSWSLANSLTPRSLKARTNAAPTKPISSSRVVSAARRRRDFAMEKWSSLLTSLKRREQRRHRKASTQTYRSSTAVAATTE